MSRYLLVLVFSISVPLVLSFYPKLNFYRRPKALFLSLGAVTLIYGLWDVLAVFRGHWWFSDSGVWRLRIINLPLEEILFFPVITFCCIFTWEALKYLKHRIK
ncbi:MAG: lycopene cyclase domain-containing protein [Candidatus Omnitrophota bacterium]